MSVKTKQGKHKGTLAWSPISYHCASDDKRNERSNVAISRKKGKDSSARGGHGPHNIRISFPNTTEQTCN